MSDTFRGWVRAACALALCGAFMAAQAEPMPNAQRAVSITAREQPVAAFLQDLFATIDVPAAISPGLAGSVNGTFTGPAEKVLRDVTRIYNLVSYFDGAVMHVVPAAEVVRKTFAVAPAASDRVLRQASDLGMPDARNTLRRAGDGNMLAVGTKRFVDQVEDLVRADQAAPAGAPAGGSSADFRVFYLRYAWAQDVTMTFGGRQVVLPGVASVLRSLVGARPGSPLGQETQLRPTVPGLRGQGLASQGAQKVSASSKAESAADTLVAALQRTAQPAPEAAPTLIPDAQAPRIEADPRLNAVIVRDQADRLPRYEQLIAALDVEPQTLEIEATIIDVNTDRLRDLGVNWRWNNAGFGLQVGDGATSALPKAGGVASAVLGSIGQFVSRINALQSEGAARVVSSPQVVTLSDVEAVFDNSSTFFVRVAGREQVDLFNVSAGTSLRVTPHVFRDKDSMRIKLMVNIEDGSLSNRQVDQIPVVERSTINTQALIVEGESLLIGGLTRDATSSSTDKVPGLGDVPVLGNLFKNRTSSSARIERMFLITPRLAAARPAATGALLRTSIESPNAVATTPGVQAPAAPGTPPAAVPAAAPALYTPPARASVVVDLDAMPADAPATPPRAAPPGTSLAAAGAAPAPLRTKAQPDR